MAELPWIAEARKHLGLKEIAGPKHNPEIKSWLKDLGAWWEDDETSWCSVFIAHCLKKGGRALIKDYYRAKAWAAGGLTKLDAPAYGCLAVKSRQGGGHVFFVVGKDAKGRILGLGGNQSDMVSIVPFDPALIEGYYWPSKLVDGKPVPSYPTEERYNLPDAKITARQGSSES